MPFLLLSLLWIQAFFSFSNLFATWFYFQEISSNLGLYWLCDHLLSIAFVLVFGRRSKLRHRVAWIVLLGALSWQYISPLIEFYAAPSPGTHSTAAARLRVFSANVFMPNQNFRKLGDMIRGYSPDLVGVMEVDKTWLSALDLAKEYPHRIELPRDDYFGLAIYSRYPFSRDAITSVGDQLPPVIHTEIELPNGARVELMYLHTIQPLFPESFYANRVLVRRLSTPLRHSDNPVLVFGDLNANWYSDLYKRFRDAGNLEDAMAGYGVLRTWNAQNPLFHLTVDHLLYRGLSVQDYARGPEFGSDHFPIMAEFWVPLPAPRSLPSPIASATARP